jgi:hypothetical protein
MDHRLGLRTAANRGPQKRVMRYHDHVIACNRHIHLESIDALTDRIFESGYGVLGASSARSSMTMHQNRVGGFRRVHAGGHEQTGQ